MSNDYSFQHNFSFIPFVCDWVRDRVDKNRMSQSFAGSRSIGNLKHIVDGELRMFGLPFLEEIHIYNRPPFFVQDIHVDAYPQGTEKYVTYNIPVDGCDSDCLFQLFDGEYEKIRTEYVSQYGITPFYKLVWKSEPRLMHTVSTDKPHFFNIAYPHRVITSSSQRLMAGLRFRGSWSFSEYKRRLYER